jgi:parallel beta-helix repeat protein
MIASYPQGKLDKDLAKFLPQPQRQISGMLKKLLKKFTYSAFILLSSLLLFNPPSIQNVHADQTQDIIQSAKTNGCLWSGLLNGAGDDYNVQSHFDDEFIPMLVRSRCLFLSRSVETWAKPPDFAKIRANIQRIKAASGKDYIYEMMIAEAIPATYKSEFGSEYSQFDFSAMCADQQPVDYGRPQNCIPSLDKPEYRRYLEYVTQQAIDSGIRSFLFGQVYFQDPNWNTQPLIRQVIQPMRDYAAGKGTVIVIGAQTNHIITPSYLQNFDYILGGVFFDDSGSINFDSQCKNNTAPNSNGNPWWDCAAHLWHDTYRNSANNVLITLDHESILDDDIHRFARLSKTDRAALLSQLYSYMQSKNVGFIMPFLVNLSSNLRGNECYGLYPWIYSAANSGGSEKSDLNPRAYSCQDESAINSILPSAFPLQQQIDNLPVSGGEVFLPAGTYILDTASGGVETFPDGSPIQSAIVINKNNVTLRGEGPSTVLQLAPNTKMRAVSITSSNVTIKDLVIDGNKNQRDGSVPWPNGDVVDALLYASSTASDITIENVEVKNGIEDGIGFWKASNVLAQNNYSHDNGTPQAGGAGISLSGVTHATARDNRIENNTATGIWSAFDANDVKILNNTVSNNASGGITIGGGTVDVGLGANNSGFEVKNNILSGNGSAGFASITIFASQNGTLDRNRIDTSPYDNIQIDGTQNILSADWTISRNVCSSEPGIRDLGRSQNIVLKSNLCQTNLTQQTPPADLDLNAKVDIFDYNLLVSEFGQTGDKQSDIDLNGKVDIFDYNILVANFGKT